MECQPSVLYKPNFDYERLEFENEKKKNENCTILISKGNSYCCRKSSVKEPWFIVSSEELSTEIDILILSPIQAQTGAAVA